ncbi:putative Zn-dependent protease [Sphingomonas kaistensis]|uniref:Putative Zn-dependent protease n=1 Tax=Sphingomonas kaistensis TaxID=298708 RepID=A0A7X5Y5A0_9SPHN|nr:M48 family metalloprotease [Sphingomonas kaistensis]NJC05356.1 putative Zn-dependent protease [Sphingomonas kaistensis]
MRRVNPLSTRLMLFLALVFAAAQPAAAQSILRDSETEKLFNDMSRPLIEAAKLDPKNVKIVLINDPEINAFVAGGQIVYVHTGLITSADNANQVQGVIAHELGHVVGGHVIRSGEGAKQATGISILSLVLGGLAMAAGAGEAAMGAMAIGQQVAMGQFLAFTRAQETSADLAGASYLAKAGVSGQGSIQFFKKLQNQEYRLAVYATDSYNRTHPLSSERVASLSELYQKDPAWNRPTDPALEARFQRVRAKLIGFISDKQGVLRTYPTSDTSVPAHYARAYAYHRMGDRDAALREADALLATAPQDPFYLELKGQILLESGKPMEALAPLRTAVAKAPDQPMIQAMLGHALLATEKNDNLPEAEKVLRASIGRDNEQPFAWYQLGVIYDRKGDQPRASLATAERYSLEGEPKLALASAERALKGIPQGTPDFLRAQDIAMVSRTEVEKDRKGRGK